MSRRRKISIATDSIPKAGHYPPIEDNNILPNLIARRTSAPERRGDCTRPSAPSAEPLPPA
eukprot:3056168-Pyramimonas_sp.AAC.1